MNNYNMIELGKIIKEKRIASELTIQDVKSYLRITEEYVIAIEEANIAAFSSKAYYYGYLKQYLAFLDIKDVSLDLFPHEAPVINTVSHVEIDSKYNYTFLIIAILSLVTIYLIFTNFYNVSGIDPITLEYNNQITKLVENQ